MSGLLQQNSSALPLVTFSLFVMSVISVSLGGVGGVQWFVPWLISIAVFYWSVHEPKWVPLILLFFLGLIEDGLFGAPFGLHALGLLLLSYMVGYQRLYLEMRPFGVLWVSFAVDLLIVISLLCMVMALCGLELTWWPFASWGVTVILFPVVYAICDRIGNRLLGG